MSLSDDDFMDAMNSTKPVRMYPLGSKVKISERKKQNCVKC